jgi:hypothetical protein
VAFVSPVTRQVVALPSVVQVLGASTPSSAVTLYAVIAEPWSEGAVHETDKVPFPAVSETDVGASGAVASAKAGGDQAATPTDSTSAIALAITPVRLVRIVD